MKNSPILIDSNKHNDKALNGYFKFRINSGFNRDGYSGYDKKRIELSKILLEKSNFIIVLKDENISNENIRLLESFSENCNHEVKESFKSIKVGETEEIELHSEERHRLNFNNCEIGTNIFCFKFENYEDMNNFIRHKLENSELNLITYTTLKEEKIMNVNIDKSVNKNIVIDSENTSINNTNLNNKEPEKKWWKEIPKSFYYIAFSIGAIFSFGKWIGWW